jgi:Major Facilitator Superfamily
MSGPSSAPNPRRWLALALLGTAFFMVILDSTIVYVALPLIQDDLGFSTGSVQWVMSSYLICFGGLLLLGGRTADLLGRRRVFMVGVALFGASSLACGLAGSGGVLVGARVVQGASAAVMAPSALSLLLTVFPDGADRNKALGIWGGLGGIGATAGLLIGGPVTEGLGWEWVFFCRPAQRRGPIRARRRRSMPRSGRRRRRRRARRRRPAVGCGGTDRCGGGRGESGCRGAGVDRGVPSRVPGGCRIRLARPACGPRAAPEVDGGGSSGPSPS